MKKSFHSMTCKKGFIESCIPPGRGSSLLDVGSGTGSLVLNLSDSFKTFVGIDPDREIR